MTATCPNCGVGMDLAGHKAGALVKCSCETLLVITDAGKLALAPPDAPAARLSLFAEAEQIRQRLALELEGLHDYQVEGLASKFRHMAAICLGELHRRRSDPSVRLRRDP